MKIDPPLNRREKTRAAILEALAAVIVETGGTDFSVQQVADRAGVTHRTVYNHFPTREALRDGLGDLVEAQLARVATPPDQAGITVEGMPAMVKTIYGIFEQHPDPIRVCARFMLASGGPARVTSHRTTAVRRAIEQGTPAAGSPPISSHAAAAAVRMFASSIGWHLLTEHYGLSPAEAAATASWATATLLHAATVPSA